MKTNPQEPIQKSSHDQADSSSGAPMQRSLAPPNFSLEAGPSDSSQGKNGGPLQRSEEDDQSGQGQESPRVLVPPHIWDRLNPQQRAQVLAGTHGIDLSTGEVLPAAELLRREPNPRPAFERGERDTQTDIDTQGILEDRSTFGGLTMTSPGRPGEDRAAGSIPVGPLSLGGSGSNGGQSVEGAGELEGLDFGDLENADPLAGLELETDGSGVTGEGGSGRSQSRRRRPGRERSSQPSPNPSPEVTASPEEQSSQSGPTVESDQSRSGQTGARAGRQRPDRPYGDNEVLNSVAGIGEAILESLSITREDLDRAADAYYRDDGGLIGTLEAIDHLNPFADIRRRAVQAYEGTEGGLVGVLTAIDAINPFSAIRDGFIQGYEAEGGGFLGVLNGIDQVNPFGAIRRRLENSYEAVNNGDAREASKQFFLAVLDTITLQQALRGAAAPAAGMRRRRRRNGDSNGGGGNGGGTTNGGGANGNGGTTTNGGSSNGNGGSGGGVTTNGGGSNGNSGSGDIYTPEMAAENRSRGTRRDREVSRRISRRELREAFRSGEMTPRQMEIYEMWLEEFGPQAIEDFIDTGRMPRERGGVENSHPYGVATHPELADRPGDSIPRQDHRTGVHGGDTRAPLNGDPRDPGWRENRGYTILDEDGRPIGQVGPEGYDR